MEARKQNYQEVVSNRDRTEQAANKAYGQVKLEQQRGDIKPESIQAAQAAILARDAAIKAYEEHPVEAPAFAAMADLANGCVIPYRRFKQQ